MLICISLVLSGMEGGDTLGQGREGGSREIETDADLGGMGTGYLLSATQGHGI